MFSIRVLAGIVLLLLSHCSLTLQVDIQLRWNHLAHPGWPYQEPMVAVCLDIPPGDCCKPHEDAILPGPESLHDYDASHVRFTGLRTQQLGAGYGATTPRYDGIACSGTPLVRFFGPDDPLRSPHGQPRFQAFDPNGRLVPPMNLVFSASWIDLRTRFPPDSAAARYLQWQGVKRMVWGSDTWSAASDGIPFPRRKREREQQRLNGWAQTGQVTISTPRRWRYPDLYSFNGTDFRKGGDGVFQSSDGRVLNLTSGEIG